ncbi:WD40-repeat-containing domain protein [Spinellus fusiger]|nr:WD40-repeat-containing domain protein [Spinellus fusiger]
MSSVFTGDTRVETISDMRGTDITNAIVLDSDTESADNTNTHEEEEEEEEEEKRKEKPWAKTQETGSETEDFMVISEDNIITEFIRSYSPPFAYDKKTISQDNNLPYLNQPLIELKDMDMDMDIDIDMDMDMDSLSRRSSSPVASVTTKYTVNESCSEAEAWEQYTEKTPEPLPFRLPHTLPLLFSQVALEPQKKVIRKKKSWGYISQLNTSLKKRAHSDNRIIQKPVTTYIPQNMTKREVLDRLDAYLDSIGPFCVSDDVSPDIIPTKFTRNSRTRQPIVTKSPSKNAISDIPLAKPYIPSELWSDSNWEDWSQFEVGDIIHWPFTESEKNILISLIEPKLRSKKNIAHLDWNSIPMKVPGRTVSDCQYFWTNYREETYALHTHPVMIKRPARKSISGSFRSLLLEDKLSQTASQRTLDIASWCSLKTAYTFGEGSGDVFSLGIFQNPKTNTLKIAAGSTCDAQVEYNMPGNLRLWSQSSETVQCLPGHNTPIRQPDTSMQDYWTTVSDVKVSTDHKLVFSASYDNRAMVWCAETGTFLSKLEYHSKKINQIAVKQEWESNILATGSEDGDAVIWHVNKKGTEGTGALCILHHENMLRPAIECIEFGHFASSNLLFAGVKNTHLDCPGMVKLWDISANGKLLKAYHAKNDITSLAVDENAMAIAAGVSGAGGYVQIWTI